MLTCRSSHQGPLILQTIWGKKSLRRMVFHQSRNRHTASKLTLGSLENYGGTVCEGVSYRGALPDVSSTGLSAVCRRCRKTEWEQQSRAQETVRSLLVPATWIFRAETALLDVTIFMLHLVHFFSFFFFLPWYLIVFVLRSVCLSFAKRKQEKVF